MPITIATYRAEDDTLTQTEFWDCAEVAAMLRMHPGTVRRKVREGQWPCIRLNHKPYLSAAMIGEAVETITQRVGLIPEVPPRIGEPVSCVETEPVR